MRRGGGNGPHRRKGAAFRGAGQRGGDIGQGLQGLLQGNQIAGIGRAGADTRREALKVGNAPQGIAQVAAQQGIPGGFGDSALPVVNFVQRQQRLVKPFA